MRTEGTLAGRVTRLIDRVHAGNVNAAAKDMGLAQTTLAQIASGKVTNPRTAAVERIAWFYGAGVGWLLAGEGSEPRILTANLGETIPQTEGLRWLLIVESLEGSPALTTELIYLPEGLGQSARATFRAPPKARQIADLLEANRLHFASWIGWLRLLIDVHGVEKTRAILEAFIPVIRRRFAPKGRKGAGK